MNIRISCIALVLLSLAACGQAGKLVLPEKNTPPPHAAEVKPAVVAPIPEATPTAPADAAPTTPAQPAPDAPKKEQP
jgi:predicted small lipoprotein YifL